MVFTDMYVNAPALPWKRQQPNICLLSDLHSGATGSTWLTSRGTRASNSFSRPESWRRSGWISLKWPCEYTETHEQRSSGRLQSTPRTAAVCIAGKTHCVLVRAWACLFPLCLHARYSKAKRGVDSFMCTVWSGLSCNQAHTPDNSTITHTHTQNSHVHTQTHT